MMRWVNNWSRQNVGVYVEEQAIVTVFLYYFDLSLHFKYIQFREFTNESIAIDFLTLPSNHLTYRMGVHKGIFILYITAVFRFDTHDL